MLGGEAEERQQRGFVVRDPLDDLGVLRPVLLGEGSDGPGRMVLVLGAEDLLDRVLGGNCADFGRASRTFAVL